MIRYASIGRLFSCCVCILQLSTGDRGVYVPSLFVTSVVIAGRCIPSPRFPLVSWSPLPRSEREAKAKVLQTRASAFSEGGSINRMKSRFPCSRMGQQGLPMFMWQDGGCHWARDSARRIMCRRHCHFPGMNEYLLALGETPPRLGNHGGRDGGVHGTRAVWDRARS
jgi:hypothetical protein